MPWLLPGFRGSHGRHEREKGRRGEKKEEGESGMDGWSLEVSFGQEVAGESESESGFEYLFYFIYRKEDVGLDQVGEMYECQHLAAYLQPTHLACLF